MRGLGGDGRLLNQLITALGIAFEVEIGRYDIEDVTSNLEQVRSVTVLELKLDLGDRSRRTGRVNFPLVERQDDIGAVSIHMVGRTHDPGLENPLQCFVFLIDENRIESRALHLREIRLIIVNRLLPFGALEGAHAIIDGVDGLDVFVALVADPQGQSVIAKRPVIGIEIDGLQCFANGIAKNVRKMRMLAERNEITGRSTQLQFGGFPDHYAYRPRWNSIGGCYLAARRSSQNYHKKTDRGTIPTAGPRILCSVAG